MSEKPLSDFELGLKASVRRAVKMAGGPVAAAEETRVDAPRLSRYGNPFDPLMAPIDVAADLDRAAGDDVILRAWAAARGFELRPIGAAGAAEDDMRRLGADVLRAALNIASELNKASADGRPSAARLADEIAAGARALTDMDARVSIDADEPAANVAKLRRR